MLRRPRPDAATHGQLVEAQPLLVIDRQGGTVADLERVSPDTALFTVDKKAPPREQSRFLVCSGTGGGAVHSSLQRVADLGERLFYRDAGTC